MKKIKKIFVIFLVTTISIVNFTYAAMVTLVTDNPPVNYFDTNLSAKINSTRTVLEMKNLVSSYMEFPTVTFGSYVQGIFPLIKSPIEWIILEKRGNVAILMSKYVLDQQTFHNTTGPVFWNQSYLKNWLSNNFFHTAFTDQEKNSVLQNNDSLMGRVYALNINEISYYFIDSMNRDISATDTTKHAQNVRSSNEAMKNGYWLRPENEVASVVSSKVLFKGIADTVDCSANCTFGVRPVINVAFDPGILPTDPASPVPVTPVPAPTPTPSPIPYTPQPVIDRSLCVEGRVYKRGTVKKTFTVRYYANIIDSVDKKISVKVHLKIPVINSNNPLKAITINNLLNYNAYNLLRGFLNDYIENKQILYSPVSVRPMQIEKDQGETVEIPFELEGVGQICRLVIDIPTNQCNLEEN